MSKKTPYRSKKGCLTCKRRKKKCDETQPQCRRCFDGGFDCLGYNHPSASKGTIAGAGVEELNDPETLNTAALLDHSRSSNSISSLESWTGEVPLWTEGDSIRTQWVNSVQIYGQTRPNIPKAIRFDPFEVENMVDFVVLQLSRFPNRTSFRPLPFSPEHAMAQYLKTSSYIRWSMYIGARIGQAMSEGTSWYPYIGWVGDFRSRMLSLPVSSETEAQELDIRLKSLHNLAGSFFAAMGTPAGYMLHRQNLPLFLELATRLPEVWTNNYEMSISQALHCQDSSILQFIFTDTITALVLAIPPLACYDTTIGPGDWFPPSDWSRLYWINGWPAAILILFAKINSFRIARQQLQPPLSESERLDIEKGLEDWKPAIDHDVNSSNSIAQLAVQECWRHTLLIYLYMAACGVNSADPKVENLVRQVYLLVGTIEDGHMPEEHLFIPCLIAGIAARKEKHRRTFYKKIPARQHLSQFLLRGSDFIPVLDHLWHGAASEGRAATWDDYVNSRSSVIPIPA